MGGILSVAADSVPIDTESIHIAGVAHKGFELTFRELLGNADKKMR